MQTKTLTEKQQYWLKHIEAIDKFDGTLKQYAADHSLVLQDIYSWKSQLRQRGVIGAVPQSPQNGVIAGFRPNVRECPVTPLKALF